jgi:hypothetical protein
MLKNASYAEIDACVEIDGKAVDRYGLSYSDERWGRKEFTAHLPEKFLLSNILLINKKVFGYAIISRKPKKSYWLHRLAINGLKSTEKIKIFQSIINPLPNLGFLVSCDNNAAISFYLKAGLVFDNLSRQEEKIMQFQNFRQHGLIVETQGGQKCYLMKKE